MSVTLVSTLIINLLPFRQAAREILDLAASHVKPGISTDEIDEIVHKATVERGGYPSPLNYRGYPKSVCTWVILVSARSIVTLCPAQVCQRSYLSWNSR